jgi:hypothetical protein
LRWWLNEHKKDRELINDFLKTLDETNRKEFERDYINKRMAYLEMLDKSKDSTVEIFLRFLDADFKKAHQRRDQNSGGENRNMSTRNSRWRQRHPVKNSK